MRKLLLSLLAAVPLIAATPVPAPKAPADAAAPDLTMMHAQVILAHLAFSSGSTHDPLPIGTWKIHGADYNPRFHYNPALFWDAKKGDTKAMLPAGPNGPVGVVWLDLSKEHYGIHGTPEPGLIGRTASHGCVRLTNWDAARVAMMVRPRTPAIFTE